MSHFFMLDVSSGVDGGTSEGGDMTIPKGPLNCPIREKDPMAWTSFHLATQDPSIIARLRPPAPRRGVFSALVTFFARRR